MFMNTEMALAKHQGEVSEQIYKDLADFDSFHLLCKGTKAYILKLASRYGNLPIEYLDWSTYCSGGLLFETDLFSLQARDVDLDVPLYTFEEETVNAEKHNLGSGFLVFAKASYGDYFCFPYNVEARRCGDQVLQWNIEEEEFTAEWPSFYDWMREQLEEAIEAIAEEELEPIPLKLEDI